MEGGEEAEGGVAAYLPVSYRILDADAAFFLQEAQQDLRRNASLQTRTEAFFIQRTRRTPVLAVSYGPCSLRRPLPPQLLQGVGPGPVAAPPALGWKVQAFVLREQVHPSWPRVQVLFHLLGRGWDQEGGGPLPCVAVVAFHQTQEVHGGCRLEGALGLCVAQLQPPAAWFLVPRTPVELYYQLQPPHDGGGDCGPAASAPAGGPAGGEPLRRIGSIRLLQPLVEQQLDQNFVVTVPSEAARQGEALTAFLGAAAAIAVETFSLRSVPPTPDQFQPQVRLLYWSGWFSPTR